MSDDSPAFPLSNCGHSEHGSCPGMTLREYAAIHAMQGLLARLDATQIVVIDMEDIALDATTAADALLTALGTR